MIEQVQTWRASDNSLHSTLPAAVEAELNFRYQESEYGSFMAWMIGEPNEAIRLLRQIAPRAGWMSKDEWRTSLSKEGGAPLEGATADQYYAK